MFEVTDHDGIVVLRMAHGRANAMDADFLRGFTAQLRDLDEPDAVILTGTGSVFSAGADLFRVRDEGPAYVERSLPALSEAFTTLFTFPRPVVAAINGHAIAGGAVFACAADHRLMARGGGTIGIGELRVGVPFPVAAFEIFRFAVTHREFSELVTFAESFEPDAAVGHGLIDAAVEPGELMPRALEAARRLAAIPRASFTHTKMALRRPALERIERDGPAADAEAVRIWSSPEMRERIDAFLVETFGEKARRKT